MLTRLAALFFNWCHIINDQKKAHCKGWCRTVYEQYKQFNAK